MRSFCASVVACAVLFGVGLVAQPAAAQPIVPQLPSLSDVINQVVPPHAGDLQQSMLPSDVGDAFFDVYPDNLSTYDNGEVIEWRDITAASAGMFAVPVRQVFQFKFRTNDSKGEPSFGTASLVVPASLPVGEANRPVVVNNLPIDALGRRCTPGYTMSHGIGWETNPTDYVPPVTTLAAARGYAVLIPDHEGPKMAYAEPRTAGHIVLDSIRALKQLRPEFQMSRFGMAGYSGGSIATNGAAKLLPSYAPELAGQVVGAALGGTPVDEGVLAGSMTSWYNWAKGVFIGAAYGISREQPDIAPKMNNLGAQIAPYLRDLCIIPIALLGPLPLPFDILAVMPDPLHSDFAYEVYARNSLKGVKYGAPLFVYNGAQEFWIPAVMARELYAEQCALGTPSVLRLPVGEHGIAALTGLSEALSWLDQRLRGVPAPSEC